GVVSFGPCDGAMTLPSGAIAGSRSGRDMLVSAGVAPGGRSSPPLRPHPARPSAVTSTAVTAIRAKNRADILGSPSAGKHIGRRRREHGKTAKCEAREFELQRLEGQTAGDQREKETQTPLPSSRNACGLARAARGLAKAPSRATVP